MSELSFDIPQMHLADDSPEARVIEAIVDRDHITPEEVVRRALRDLAVQSTQTENVILTGRGLFGSSEDAEALDAAVTLAYEERRQPSGRQISI